MVLELHGFYIKFVQWKDIYNHTGYLTYFNAIRGFVADQQLNKKFFLCFWLNQKLKKPKIFLSLFRQMKKKGLQHSRKPLIFIE